MTTTTPAIPLAEFDQEMATTRRLLERVPADRIEWKPHPKSFALGHLAQLISWMPGWIARTLHEPFIDLSNTGNSYSFQPPDKHLEEFDRSVKSGRAALEKVTGATLDEEWTLRMKGQVLLAQPKGVAVRGHLNHLIHHRGQLTVNLRLVDVPLPMIYGPTADERW